MCDRVSSAPAVPGTCRARRSTSGAGGCRSACALYLLSSGTRFFRSRAPMPWVMNQRPSLVWQMLGLWLGPSDAWRQGNRHTGTRPRGPPPTAPVHQVLLGVFRNRLVDRERNILPLAAAFAVDQCGDDAGRHLLAGDVVGVPDLRRDRRRVVFEIGVGVVAAIHH